MYIKREDAIRAIAEQECYESNTDFGNKDTVEDWLDYASGILADIPSADVVERKRGKWIDKISKGGFLWQECSECKALRRQLGFYENFCPHCGCDMRGNDK